MGPAVSILMPLRNAAPFLTAAVDSLLRQTFTNWELVAVDDYSTDDTTAILRSFDDDRIRIIASRSPGLVGALNTGLTACRAPLMARMDGDDICHPMRLQRQVAWMKEHEETDLVATSFRHFPRQTLAAGMLRYESWQNTLTTHELIMRDLFVESPFVHPSIMIRKYVLEDVGGYRDCGWAEDYDLWLRLAAAGKRFHRLPEVLFFWREGNGRATRTMTQYAADAFRRCKVHHLVRGYLKRCSAVVMAGAGTEGRKFSRLLAEEGVKVAAWVDLDPRKIGRELHGAPVRHADEQLPPGMPLLLVVGTPGARETVRRWAIQRGLQEGTDFITVT